MLILSSVTLFDLGASLEFYFTVMDVCAVFSAVNDLVPENSSTFGYM
jgi:hypothetical protein